MIRGTMATLLAGGVLLFGLAAPAATQKQKVTLVKTWKGKVKDEALKQVAPADGFIANAKDFEKLWKAWRTDEKVPEVDFRKELVLVQTAGGPNTVNIVGSMDDDGNLKVSGIATLIGGPGFGYAIATTPRAGVKTVNGKQVPAP